MAIPSNYFDQFLAQPAAAIPPADVLLQGRRLIRPPLVEEPQVAPAEPIAPAPEVDPGILETLGNTAMSGLATVGNVLDLPGSMVRDVLTLNNPFDQLLTPTSSENRNTGRDVLTKWGATEANDPDKWEVADFLGFGVEVLADPLTYLSAGGSAVGKGGLAAKNAGLMDDLLKVVPANVGPRQARVSTSLDDLLRARPTDVPADDLAKGLDGAWDIGRGQALSNSAKGLGVELSTLGDDALDQFTSQPLGGLASFKVPFTSMDPIVLGTGETGQKIARGLDTLGTKIHDAKLPFTDFAPVASLDALLNPAIGGATTSMGRRVLRDVTGGRRIGEEAARGQIADAAEPLLREGAGFAEPTTDAERALRRVFEGVDAAPNAGVQKTFDAVRAVIDPMVPQAEEWGLNLHDLADSVTKYFPRQLTKTIKRLRGKGEPKIVTATDDFAKGRLPFLRGLGEGTDTVYQLLEHPEIKQLLDNGGDAEAVAELIRTNFAGKVPGTFNEITSTGKIGAPPGSKATITAAREAEEAAAKLEGDALLAEANADPFARNLREQATVARADATAKQAALRAGMKTGAVAGEAGGRGTTFATKDRPEALAEWLTSLDEPTRASGVFGNHPIQDALARAVGFQQSFETAKRVLTNLADDSVLAEAAKRSRTAETVPLGKLLEGVGMLTGHSVDEAGEVLGGGALRKWLTLKGLPVTADNMKAAKNTPIPADFAADIARLDKAFKGPDAVGPIVKALDDFTGLFKVGVLTWPARYVRDLVSGQFQNWAANQWSPRALKDAHRIVTGQAAEDLAGIPIIRDELRRAGLTPTAEHASDAFRKLAYRFKVLSSVEPIALPNGGMPSGSGIDNLVSEFPGKTFAGKGYPLNPGADILQALKPGGSVAGRPTTYNPLKAEYRGVHEGTDNTFAPAAAGDIAGHYTDALNRLTPFVELLRKGVHPKEAARRVRDAQIDYTPSAQTKFSREVVGRAFPFAKFTMGAVPYTLSQLWEHPGGKLAQTIRASRSASSNDASTPDYVAETLSVPLGTADDGTKRYLSGLGLMHEDPLGFVGGGARGMLLEAGSRLNPIAKAPLEWATGESFFQRGPTGGRDLSSMDPTVGRTLANVVGREDPVTFPGSDAIEFVLGNSPVSRLLTSARTATDPRKGLLAKASVLTSGIRIADISPAAQDAVLRERVQQLQRDLGARDFTTTSLNEERLAQLPPEEQAKFRELKETMDTLTKRAKERKAAKALVAE